MAPSLLGSWIDFETTALVARDLCPEGLDPAGLPPSPAPLVLGDLHQEAIYRQGSYPMTRSPMGTMPPFSAPFSSPPVRGERPSALAYGPLPVVPPPPLAPAPPPLALVPEKSVPRVDVVEPLDPDTAPEPSDAGNQVWEEEIAAPLDLTALQQRLISIKTALAQRGLLRADRARVSAPVQGATPQAQAAVPERSQAIVEPPHAQRGGLSPAPAVAASGAAAHHFASPPSSLVAPASRRDDGFFPSPWRAMDPMVESATPAGALRHFILPQGGVPTRLRAFADWLYDNFAPSALFLADGTGSPLGEYGASAALTAAGAVLADAMRRAGSALGAKSAAPVVYLPLPDAQTLSVVPVVTGGMTYCVGLASARALGAPEAEMIARTMLRALEG
jgi:hypothetical protein